MRGVPDVGIRRVAGRVPPGFLSRSMLLSELRISEHDLKYLEDMNVVKPSKIDERGGWRLYHRSVVDALLATPPVIPPSARRNAHDDVMRGDAVSTSSSHVGYSDEQGAKVFELLKAGKPLEDIVIETRYHPIIVRAAANDYASFTGGMIVSKASLDAIHALPIEGVEVPIVSEGALVDLLRRYVELTCSSCKRRPPASRCMQCLNAEAQERLARARAAASAAVSDETSEPNASSG